MNIFRLTAHFGDEQTCRIHFKALRDQEGISCKKCQHTEHYWKRDKWSYECKSCRFRTSLRSGTLLENSNLSFLTWYRAIFLMSVTKKGFSAKEMQRQLGMKRYEPVWAMVHKLRTAIDNKDARYTLEGMVEMDEGYFTVALSEPGKTKGKQGRGVSGKRNVSVMVESSPLEDGVTSKTSRQARCFKAKILDTQKSAEINETVQKSLDEPTIVFFDQSTSYVDISDYIELHITEKPSKASTSEPLNWVHLLISNPKRNQLGGHNVVQCKYLQPYLNELVYKLNRRYFGEGLFDRMIIAAITRA
jgi:hypothetical protein